MVQVRVTGLQRNAVALLYLSHPSFNTADIPLGMEERSGERRPIFYFWSMITHFSRVV